MALAIRSATTNRAWRAFGWTHAAVTAVVVVGTGNHWVLDAVVGWLVVGAAWYVTAGGLRAGVQTSSAKSQQNSAGSRPIVPSRTHGGVSMRVSTVVAAIATFSLGLGVVSQAAAAPDEPKQRASARVASKALADARAVTDDNPATGVTDGHDASLVLRDLLKVRDQLTGADRAAADRILARPTDDGDDDYYGPATQETRLRHLRLRPLRTRRP